MKRRRRALLGAGRGGGRVTPGLNGALASFEEDLTGSLEPGTFADLGVRDPDLPQIDPAAVMTVPAGRTMVGGRSACAA